jgi:predicted dienelactone hydrolase
VPAIIATLIVSSTPAGAAWNVSEELAGWFDDARVRAVDVALYAPDPAETQGPHPVIVVSHGLSESRTSYGYLGRYLAARGYIVISVNHAGSDADALESGGTFGVPTGPILFDRTADLRFVLDRVEAGATGSALLDGRTDPSRVGVVGHSLGSTTALVSVGLELQTPPLPALSFPDPRVRAAVALSPQIGNALGEPADPDCLDFGIHAGSWNAIEASVLFMWGSRDTGDCALSDDPMLRRVAYEATDGEHTYLVVIENAQHHAFTDSVPWYPGSKRDARHHDWIAEATAAFFDAHLDGNVKARRWLWEETLEQVTAGEVTQESKTAPKPQTAAAVSAGDSENRDGNHRELSGPADRRAETATAEDAPVFEAEIGPYRVVEVDLPPLYDAQRDKELQLRVTYPDAKGPRPIIVYSHYSGGSNDEYGRLTRHWAAHGFVSILADHSDSPDAGGTLGEKALGDRDNRPRDVSFVIDSLGTIAAMEPALQGRLDASRIGVGGHYLGAYTASFVAGATNQAGDDFSDPRVIAVLLMSPQGTGQGLTEDSWNGILMPMLVTTGSEDPSERTGNPPEWRTEPYLYAPAGDKYLLWVTGLSSEYGGLVTHAGGEPHTSIAGWIRQATTEFWLAFLGGDKGSRADLAPERWQELSAGAVQLSVK